MPVPWRSGTIATARSSCSQRASRASISTGVDQRRVARHEQHALESAARGRRRCPPRWPATARPRGRPGAARRASPLASESATTSSVTTAIASTAWVRRRAPSTSLNIAWTSERAADPAASVLQGAAWRSPKLLMGTTASVLMKRPPGSRFGLYTDGRVSLVGADAPRLDAKSSVSRGERAARVRHRP